MQDVKHTCAYVLVREHAYYTTVIKLKPGVTMLDIEVVEAFAGVVILPVRVDAVGAVLLLGVV